MQRILLAIAIALTVHIAGAERLFAQCPGGVCKRPVRNAISAIPTLAPRARTHSARPAKATGVERSVVWHGRSNGREWFGFFRRARFCCGHR